MMADRVELLADNPHLIAAVGEMRWREWGHAPEQLVWWVDVTGRAALPVTWVAIDALGEAVGAVGLAAFDIAERRDRSPWVLGMIVAEHRHDAGIGGQLMAALEVWAGQHGYVQAWVATGGRAVAFYEKCRW